MLEAARGREPGRERQAGGKCDFEGVWSVTDALNQTVSGTRVVNVGRVKRESKSKRVGFDAAGWMCQAVPGCELSV